MLSALAAHASLDRGWMLSPIAAFGLICLQRGPTILKQVDENPVPAESDRKKGQEDYERNKIHELGKILFV